MNIEHSMGQDRVFLQLARSRNVLFYHKGYFSQNIIAAMGEVVRLQLEVAGVEGPTRRKLFSSFVELAQNIMHYSSDTIPPDSADSSARAGVVCIAAEDGHHVMLCINPIATASVTALRDKLEPLRDMSLEQIKQAYKASLRANTPEDSKGAGLGFLTMARDASAPLDFAFQPRDDAPGTTQFYLKAII